MSDYFLDVEAECSEEENSEGEKKSGKIFKIIKLNLKKFTRQKIQSQIHQTMNLSMMIYQRRQKQTHKS